MARGNNRRDLYLQVSGDINGLRTAMTAGKTVINDFGGAAINVIEEVEKEMAKLGTGGLPALKQTERAYQDTFRRIGESARAAANAPSDQAAAQILDANATREAAAAATAKAQSLRILAEAASKADQATGGNSAATRAYAVAAATAALNAEAEADALREQAQVLGLVEKQLGGHVTAQRKNMQISGEARAGYQQLSYQLGDIATQYASGTSATIIFAQQSAQVVQAISLINGEAKGLIGFLSGPWGIAITAGVVALTPWVAKLLEGNDALEKGIEKLKEDAKEAETSRQAHAAFTNTLEGQIDAQRRLNEELQKGIRSQEQIRSANMAEAMSAEVKGKLELTAAEKELTAARREEAKAREELAKPNPMANDGGLNPAVIAAQAAADRVAAAEQRKRDAQTLVETAQQNQRIASVSAITAAAKAAEDPLAAINAHYDRMLERASLLATANGKLADSFQATADGIQAERAAAVKAEQDKQAAQKRSENDARNGRLTPKDIGSMLTGEYGGMVTSTTGGKHVAGSFHYRGQAVDFVPKGGMGSVTKEQIRTYLESQGVKIEELLGPGDKDHDDHFHVAFGRNRRGADSISQSADRAADQQTRNDDAYASLLSRVKDQQLRIEQSRLVTIGDLAANDRQQVDLAQQDIARAAEKGVALGQWTQAQADAVKLLSAQNAETEKATITERERSALKQQAIDAEMTQLGGQAELLQLQGQLATTARERRRIALELLDAETKQARLSIQRQLETEKDPARRAMLADEYSFIDRNAAVRRQAAERQNASPMEKFRQELADFDYEDELETAEVRYFDNLNDQLTEGAANFLKLKGAAGEFFNQLIADVIRLQIRQAFSGGGFLGKLLGIGNTALGVSAEASASLSSQAAAIEQRNLKGFSIGGWTGNGRGQVKGYVHGDEYVMDADATARIGVGTLDALRAGTLTSRVPSMPSVASAERALSVAPGFVRIEVAEGAMFEPRVAAISGGVSAQVAASTAPVLVGTAAGEATSSMARRARRTIR